jgi:hypothetical protein
MTDVHQSAYWYIGGGAFSAAGLQHFIPEKHLALHVHTHMSTLLSPS